MAAASTDTQPGGPAGAGGDFPPFSTTYGASSSASYGPTRFTLPLGGPPPEVLVSPEHMAAYAANCRRTLHYAVNGTLLAKRDHILHQMGRLRAKMLEVSHVKGVMEREVQSEASEALQRLAAAESLRQMRIQREVDELARHVDAINGLAAEVDAVTSAADSHSAEFLGRYRVREEKSRGSKPKRLSRENREGRTAPRAHNPFHFPSHCSTTRKKKPKKSHRAVSPLLHDSRTTVYFLFPPITKKREKKNHERNETKRNRNKQ